MTTPHRIDVHHHPSPPSYISARSDRDRAYPPQHNWTLAKSLDDMDRGGVATAMLSLPHSVQIWPGDIQEGRRCCRGILAEFNDSVIEYGTDTTRAIGKLLFSGSAVRYPRIRFMCSHGGGTMPFLAGRFLQNIRGHPVCPTNCRAACCPSSSASITTWHSPPSPPTWRRCAIW